jgi:hypothetical protein
MLAREVTNRAHDFNEGRDRFKQASPWVHRRATYWPDTPELTSEIS